MLSKFFSKKKESIIQVVEVDLGVCSVSIPVAELVGNTPGPTLLVTAGMDGDEYAGIEAAYRLIAELESQEFAGKITVIPVVNIPGFLGECSQNPLDGVFPKEIFPGNAHGAPTERLIHWLASTFVKDTDVWLDMHSGAITEGLNPFLRTFKVDDDSLIKGMVDSGAVGMMVCEQVRWGSVAGRIADMGCTYMMAESGARGNRRPEDVERHVVWLRTLMGCMKMVQSRRAEYSVVTRMVSSVTYIQAPHEGIWRPIEIQDNEILKGMLLGEWASFDGTETKKVYAAHDGVRLWWKETMRMQRGDVLYAIGR